jgi:hypothetical protein
MTGAGVPVAPDGVSVAPSPGVCVVDGVQAAANSKINRMALRQMDAVGFFMAASTWINGCHCEPHRAPEGHQDDVSGGRSPKTKQGDSCTCMQVQASNL